MRKKTTLRKRSHEKARHRLPISQRLSLEVLWIHSFAQQSNCQYRTNIYFTHVCFRGIQVAFGLFKLDLSTIPEGLFGASSGAASEIIRSGCLSVIASNAIVLMWMLLAVESHHVSFQPNDNDRQLSILARRAEAYKLMKESLNSQAGSSLDFAFTVSMAAGVEFRLGNSPAAEQHANAVRKILSLRGGSKAVRDITDPFGLMLVSIIVDQGDPSIFECREDLRGKVKSMVQRLHKYQSWNYSLRSESSPPSPMSIQSCLTSSSDEDDFILPILDSFERRVRAFGKDSALGKYVALPSTGPDEGGYRFLLSVLYAMNTAFWDFRNSPSASNEYLRELKTSVELTTTANLVLQAGLSKLPSLLMLMMLAHQIATNKGHTAATSIVFHDEEVFEFVNLVMMGGREIRTRVLRVLLSWLTTAASSANDLILLDDNDFEVLEQEVEETWVADQARRLVDMKLT